MKGALLTLATSALVAIGGSASAQMWYGAAVNYPAGTDAASTPASGIGHAAADVIRAEGMYNESTANAYLKFEQARRQYIDNQDRWTDAFLARQRAIAAQHDRAHEEAIARHTRYREEQIGKAKLPPRLGSAELNPNTGELAWPRALQRNTFSLDRFDIEQLLADRAKQGSTSELMEALDAKTRQMRQDLRDHIGELRTQEYLQARRFLQSLELESQFPTSEPVVAKARLRQDTNVSFTQAN